MVAVARAQRRALAKPQPSITLIPVSDQLTPAAIGWLHRPTEQVALLASPAMRNQASRLKAWFDSRSKAPKTVILPWNDGSYLEMLKQAEKLSSSLMDEIRPQIVINLTGGTKPMSMAFQHAFGKHRDQFASPLHGDYVDTNHQVIAELLAENPVDTPMRSVLNITDMLALQGIEAISAQSSASGYQKWLQREELFSLLLAPESQDWLRTWYQLLALVDSLINPRRNESNKNVEVFDRDFAVNWVGGIRSQPKLRVTLKHRNSNTWNQLQDALQGKFGDLLKRYHVCTIEFGAASGESFTLKFNRSPLDEFSFAQGSWFEAWIASHLEKDGVDEWAQGLSFKHGNATNELDVVVVCGNQTLVIEAKSGQQNREYGGQPRKGTETVYKFDSVAGKIGAHFNQRWLVCLREMQGNDVERAIQHRISIFHSGSTGKNVETLAALPAKLAAWAQQRTLQKDSAFIKSRISSPNIAGANNPPGKSWHKPKTKPKP